MSLEAAKKLIASATFAIVRLQPAQEEILERLTALELTVTTRLKDVIANLQGQGPGRGDRDESFEIPAPKFLGKDGSPEIKLWTKTISRYLEAKKHPQSK